jgi:cation diffusion facilitator family transporter
VAEVLAHFLHALLLMGARLACKPVWYSSLVLRNALMAETIIRPLEGRSPGQAGAPGKIRAALVSVVVNLFLILVKGSVGFLAGSIGLIAEAVHSLTDLTASVLAVWGIRLAEQPPDAAHAFGHARYENLSSLLQMLIIGVASGLLIYESLLRILDGSYQGVTAEWWTFAVMGGSVAVDLATSRYLDRASGASGGSAALEADSFHFLSDMWGAIAVIVGLIFARFGLKLADPIAAIVVALVISYTAFRSGVRTTGILMDKAPPRALLDRIIAVATAIPQVREVREVRARVAGKRVLLDISIGLDPTLSIQQAHEVAHHVSTELHRQVPEVMDAVVHAEPLGAQH